MLKINHHDIQHFSTHGWVQISMGQDKNFIEKCYLSLKMLEQKSIDTEYPLGRIYHPHLFKLNQAAIEAPFNQLLLDDNLTELFKKIKLGKAVKDLMNWESTACDLARLFTMDNFNYRGHWHRDFSDWNGDNIRTSTVQVAIYLKDQEGFRILKPLYDYWGVNSILDSSNVEPFNGSRKSVPLKLNSKFYDVIKGKAGHILFFSPGLMHQGSSSSKRLDFHMRFINFHEKKNYDNKMKNYSKNTFQDFLLQKEYAYNFPPDMNFISPRIEKPSMGLRFQNSLNYYSGLLNIYKIMRRRFIFRYRVPSPWQEDIFANTIFQSKK
jgi:hypothetical protein